MNSTKLTCLLLLLVAAFVWLQGCKKEDDDTSDPRDTSGYNCVNGNCERVSSYAAYSSLSLCQGSCGCTDDGSGYICVNGNCLSVSNNAAFCSLSACQNSCSGAGGGGAGGVSTGYDCVNGNCVSVFGNAAYSSLSACQNSCSSISVITDSRDGQSYKTIQIAGRTWFAENLRYSGNIAQVSSDAAWAAIWNNGNPTGQPAWCYYDNNPANDAIYGKLYNWYAVNTSNICPAGWHVPSNVEWTMLTDYLGGESVAGGKMKSTTGWVAPNAGATNESGFSGLPGGARGSDTNFQSLLFGGIGESGIWWGSTDDGQAGAFHLFLTTQSSGAITGFYPDKSTGFSVRCIND